STVNTAMPAVSWSGSAHSREGSLRGLEPVADGEGGLDVGAVVCEELASGVAGSTPGDGAKDRGAGSGGGGAVPDDGLVAGGVGHGPAVTGEGGDPLDAGAVGQPEPLGGLLFEVDPLVRSCELVDLVAGGHVGVTGAEGGGSA